MNYYKVLSVPHNATKKEIRNAYYSLAKKYHPDKNINAEEQDNFILVNAAYSTLINNVTRKTHDINLQQASISNELFRDLFNDFAKLSTFIKPTTSYDVITNIRELYCGSSKIINYENVTIMYYPIRSLEIEFENEILKLNSVFVDNLNYYIIDYNLFIDIKLHELPASVRKNDTYTYDLELPDSSVLQVNVRKVDVGKKTCYKDKGLCKMPIYEIKFNDEIMTDESVINMSYEKKSDYCRGDLYLVIGA